MLQIHPDDFHHIPCLMDKVTTFDQFHDHHQDVHHRDHHDNHGGDDDHDNRIRMPGDPTPEVILGAFLAAIHTVSPVPLKFS